METTKPELTPVENRVVNYTEAEPVSAPVLQMPAPDTPLPSHAAIAAAAEIARKKFQNENKIKLSPAFIKTIRKHKAQINQLNSEIQGMLKVAIAAENLDEIEVQTWELVEDDTALIPHPKMLPGPLPNS